MNGIEKITARIIADVETEIASQQAATEEQCAVIRAQYEQKTRELYQARRTAAEKACQQSVERLSKAARLESRQSILALKQEMVDRTFQRAKALIRELPAERYADFLAHQAAAASVTGREEILLDSQDQATYGSLVVEKANALLAQRGLPAALRLAGDAGGFAGGLILRNGPIEVNCTIEALVEMSRNDMAAQVAELLFG